MTQLTRFASVLKVDIAGARCTVTTEWWSEGSARAGDLRTGLDAIHTDLHVESSSPDAEVADLVRTAEQGCYVLSALRQSLSPTMEVALNGAPLSFT